MALAQWKTPKTTAQPRHLEDFPVLRAERWENSLCSQSVNSAGEQDRGWEPWEVASRENPHHHWLTSTCVSIINSASDTDCWAQTTGFGSRNSFRTMDACASSRDEGGPTTSFQSKNPSHYLVLVERTQGILFRRTSEVLPKL